MDRLRYDHDASTVLSAERDFRDLVRAGKELRRLDAEFVTTKALAKAEREQIREWESAELSRITEEGKDFYAIYASMLKHQGILKMDTRFGLISTTTSLDIKIADDASFIDGIAGLPEEFVSQVSKVEVSPDAKGLRAVIVKAMKEEGPLAVKDGHLTYEGEDLGVSVVERSSMTFKAKQVDQSVIDEG